MYLFGNVLGDYWTLLELCRCWIRFTAVCSHRLQSLAWYSPGNLPQLTAWKVTTVRSCSLSYLNLMFVSSAHFHTSNCAICGFCLLINLSPSTVCKKLRCLWRLLGHEVIFNTTNFIHWELSRWLGIKYSSSGGLKLVQKHFLKSSIRQIFASTVSVVHLLPVPAVCTTSASHIIQASHSNCSEEKTPTAV